MSGHEVFFNFPYAAFLLVLLFPFLYGEFALKHYRKRQQHLYTSPSLLSRLLIPRSPRLTYAKLVGWSLVWTLCCLALMQPFGNIRYSPLASSSSSSSQTQTHPVPHQVIFLVDTSASMRVADGLDHETRLEEAKLIMEDVIRQLHGKMVSLFAFTSELSAVVPPTFDYLFTRLAIKDLHINQGDVGGTRFAPVLAALREQAFSQPSHQLYTVILLTDGEDTKLQTLTGAAQEEERQAILQAIPNPQQLHLHLLSVGLGSLQTQPIPHVTFEGKPVLSKLEPEILKQLAAQERGMYYQAEEWTSWNLAQELIKKIEEETLIEQQAMQAERQVVAVKKEDILVDLYYQIPLGLALLFYFLNFLLPDVRRL